MRRVGRGKWEPAGGRTERPERAASTASPVDETALPIESVAGAAGTPALSARERRRAKRRAERAQERAASAVEGQSDLPTVDADETDSSMSVDEGHVAADALFTEDEAVADHSAADDVFGGDDVFGAEPGEEEPAPRPAKARPPRARPPAASPYGAAATPTAAQPVRKDETFVVEGRRAVDAVLEGPLPVRALIIVRPEGEEKVGADKFLDLEDRAMRRAIEVRRIAPRHAKRYLETRHPQGVAALVERPPVPDPAVVMATARRVLILDGVSDPGNAGTLLRTAWLLGWDAVFTTPGSVDLFSEKSVRASAGAIVHIPAGRVPAAAIVSAASSNGFRLVVAAPGSEASPAPAERVLLVLGNEARGAESSWPGSTPVGIAMRASAVESLGVVASGAILLHQLR